MANRKKDERESRDLDKRRSTSKERSLNISYNLKNSSFLVPTIDGMYVCILYLEEKSYSVTKESNIKYKNFQPYVILSNIKHYVKIIQKGIINQLESHTITRN